MTPMEKGLFLERTQKTLHASVKFLGSNDFFDDSIHKHFSRTAASQTRRINSTCEGSKILINEPCVTTGCQRTSEFAQ